MCMINKVGIIHGYTSHHDAEWFPWMKKQLENEKISVTIPEMPDSDYPELNSWLAELDRTLPDLDENTVLIGHSLGCITVLRHLVNKDKQIRGLVLVSGFIDKNPMRVQSKELSKFLTENLAVDKIKNLAGKIVAMTAMDDDIVPTTATAKMAENLGAQLIQLSEGKHFIARDGYRTFPVLLNIVNKMFGI